VWEAEADGNRGHAGGGGAEERREAKMHRAPYLGLCMQCIRIILGEYALRGFSRTPIAFKSNFVVILDYVS